MKEPWVTGMAKKRGEVKDKPLDIAERARLKELEDEVRRLKMEREILKKLKKRRRGLRARTCEVRLHP
jgi:hypothetical protein